MRTSPPTLGALAGLVVGAAVVVVGSLLGWPPRPGASDGAGPSGPDAPAADASSPASASAFIAAWDRSLTGTWIVEGEFERTSLRGRGVLRTPVRTVQRPPDRLVLGFGSTESRLDGRLLSCTAGPDEVARCRDGGPAGSYEGDRRRQVALLGGYVLGEDALYDVTEVGEACFALVLRVPLPAPPYGEEARFCFDAETGALVLAEIRRPEAVDVMRATEVRAAVTDDDLVPAGERT